MDEAIIYNVDASTLIYLEKYYPRKDFALIWVNLEKAFESGTIYILDKTWKEIHDYTDKEDPLLVWMEEGRKAKMVRKTEDKHTVKAAEITHDNPELVKDNVSVGSAIKEVADPYIIAHSLLEKTTVLTGEKKYLPKSGSQKIRIPHVCEKYNVPCVCLKAADQEAVVPLYLIQTLSLNVHGA